LEATFLREPGGSAGSFGGAGGSDSTSSGGAGGGGAGLGGAIFNEGGTVTITNSTLSGNLAQGGRAGAGESGAGNGQGLGGAIFNHNGSLTLRNSTISGNTAAQGGRGVYNAGDNSDQKATAVIDNTIIGQADTIVSDFVGRSSNGGTSRTSGRGNLIRTQTGFNGTITSTADPLLAPLGNRGGPTPTLGLRPGSPALDAGSNALIPGGVTTDQRGFPRISNGTVDIGAFEFLAQITLSPTLAAGTYGSPYSQTLTATGGLGPPYTFQVTSGSLPGGLTLAPSGALTGTPTVPGMFSFTVQAKDNYNLTGSQNYTLTIDKAKLTITPTAGQSKVYGAAVPTLKYTASGLVNNDPLSTITGALATTATTASPVGNYPITLGTLSAGSNYTVVLPANPPTFAVTPATLTATAMNFSATAGAPFSGPVASFTNVSPNTTAYTARIDWGDGSMSSVYINPSGSPLTVAGTHTYADAKSYTVTVQISNPNVTTAKLIDSATVTSLGQGVTKGLTGRISFWNDVKGQALIKSFGSTATGLRLANWLADTFPNLYGITTGVNSLSGKSNAQVAAYFQYLFNLGGGQAQARVLATALSVYATTTSLGGTTGLAYGFNVSATGLGARSYNVVSDGAAFGVPNFTTLNVYELLMAVNKQAVRGVLYNGNATLQAQAADLFSALNKAGSI
jgi:hypothetical protein